MTTYCKKKYQRGFTLIEVIIYLGIFAFIMTTALVSVYSIISSGSRNQAKAMVQEEGSFLLGKIDWVLSNAKNASVSVGGSTLTTTQFDGSGVTVFVSSSNNMSIQRGPNPANDLNNSNVTITCPPTGCFVHNLASGDGINPESVEADFTVNTTTYDGLSFSQYFSTIKYLRK